MLLLVTKGGREGAKGAGWGFIGGAITGLTGGAATAFKLGAFATVSGVGSSMVADSIQQGFSNDPFNIQLAWSARQFIGRWVKFRHRSHHEGRNCRSVQFNG